MHLKTAFGYIRRSPFQALAAISVLALTFFMSTVLALLVYASNKALVYFETRPQVIAFIKDDAALDDVSALQKRLDDDSRVTEVKYVSKEKAFEIYKEATADNPLLSELVSPTIFPASIEFSVTDLNFAKEIIDEVKGEGVVDSIGFTASLGGEETLGDVVERLKTITLYVRVGGAGLVVALSGASFLVLMVVIGMRISTRREEIETLDLLGATAGFIRAPIVLEALIYAFFGVLIGWIGGLILALYSAPTLISYFGEIPVIPRDSFAFFSLLGIIAASELVVGIVIALFGSLTAVGRARKSRR